MKDDRKTNTANVVVTGEELRHIRKEDIERWKRRTHKQVVAQMVNLTEMNPLDEMYQIYGAENRAYEMALKIINAKF